MHGWSPSLSSRFVPEIPAQFCQQLRLRHGKGDIRKTGLALELGSNGKAQQDIKRDMAVVPALVRQCVWERLCQPPLFHRKENIINQVRKWHVCCIYFSSTYRFVNLFLIFSAYLNYKPPPLLVYKWNLPFIVADFRGFGQKTNWSKNIFLQQRRQHRISFYDASTDQPLSQIKRGLLIFVKSPQTLVSKGYF